MFARDHRFLRFFSIVVVVFFAANILFLDYLILKNNPPASLLQIATLNTEKVEENAGCQDEACLAKIYDTIYEATASLRLATPTAVPQVAQNASSPSSVREYFVAFGTGSSSASDWTDVTGLAAYVDSTQYGNIKSVVFEASVFIPTGNEVAYVRLFNKTDQHPVWFSDVSLEGGQPQLLVSQPITLDQGNKLYQVQMKTSLQYPANLAQARLHITTY